MDTIFTLGLNNDDEEAGSENIKLNLDDFTRLGKDVPVIANLKPHGEYLMYDIYKNGGTPK